MSFVAVAIGGSALIGAGASIISGNKSAKAQAQGAQTAAEYELQASREANDLQKYMYDTTRSDFAPGREIGNAALGKLAQMYGVSSGDDTDWEAYVKADPAALNDWRMYHSGGQAVGEGGVTPDEMSLAEYGQYHYRNDGGKRDLTPYQSGAPGTAGAEKYGGFETSPGYQFRLDEGLKAIERYASATGKRFAPETMKGMNKYVQGEASSEYESYANRLAALAGVGQSATGSTAAAGSNYAGAAGSNIMQAGGVAGNAAINAGNARASAYANTGNAINSAVQGAGAAYLYTQGYGGNKAWNTGSWA